MSIKTYTVVLSIEDFDELGPDEIKDVLEQESYPNHCMYPQVVSVELEDAISAEQRVCGLEPLLYELQRRADKMGGDGADFTVTIDAAMWEQIKDFV